MREGYFFVAMVSLATHFDVRPVGWYNRRMEFLERTGIDYVHHQTQLALEYMRDLRARAVAACG